MITPVCILFLVFVVAAEETYTTKFDNIDIDEILQSDRLLKNYNLHETLFSDVLPDALNTGCLKCSDVQKRGAKKIVRHLINNKPEFWNQLIAKYDPNGTFVKQYKDEWINGPID
ncbi:hypothetical protein NQ314_018581 [Rhamnusium bicolor]|uniref:Uncharacterized protein n=1 Tax=Rhamnusium bicolor TaxID=1586634 RepID=A0AAV8WRB0_9CUCU|nr:hypothetical protein NQ314_018581 [Rhamnusium bicolor]